MNGVLHLLDERPVIAGINAHHRRAAIALIVGSDGKDDHMTGLDNLTWWLFKNGD